MNKLLLLLICFLIPLKGFNQEFSRENDKITINIKSKLVSIGKTMLKEAKSGKVTPYDNYTLKSEYPATINLNEPLEGLQVFFSEDSHPDQATKKLKISAIAPVRHLYFAGVDLGLRPIFYIKVKDMEKIISKEDFKSITILANLLFNTYFPIELDSTRLSQDVEFFIEDRIDNNSKTRGYHVELTDKYLKILNGIILNRTSDHFENYKVKSTNAPSNSFYTDEQLLHKLSNKELDSLLTQEYIIINTYDNNDSTKKNLVPLNVRVEFSNFKNVIMSPQAVGLKYELDNNKVIIFIPKTKFYSLLDGWEAFLFKEFLK